MVKKYLMAFIVSCVCSGALMAQEKDNNVTANNLDVSISTAVEPKENEEFVSHTVALGETVMLISKKYKVKPQDIYEYNPEAAQGVGARSVLQIPMHRKYKSKKVKAAEAAAAEAAANAATANN